MLRLQLGFIVAALTITVPAQAVTDIGLNGSFEATTTAAYNGGSYVYLDGTFDSWSYVGGAGLINGVAANAWFGATPPQGFDGAQYAFVQGTATLSQTFTTAASGSLALSWLEGARPGNGSNNGDQTYTVSVDNVNYSTLSSISGENFSLRSLDPLTLSAGSHTITFTGLNHTDSTVFIDAVTGELTPDTTVVPEPATWALMIAGLGMVGLAARRRTKALAA